MGLFGDVLGFFGAERKMSFEEHQAENQMQFQRDMSNTAVQRRAADMDKAGINRILAAGSGGMSGGASTPGGAKGSGAAMTSTSSAMDVKKNWEMIKNLAKTGKLLDTQELATKMNARKSFAEADNVRARTKLLNAGLPGAMIEKDIDLSKWGEALRYLMRANPLGGNVQKLLKGR